ncbi:Eco57I restriction-modification methylase domain-containing protein [Flavobacterium sp.]
MPLFQNSVVEKYRNAQNRKTISEQWIIYKAHFFNPEIQENIRNSKEEQYQGEFLIDLFVNVLGYTKNPTPNFNLTTELKNVKDSKKADGGIIVNEIVVGVIELKGTNTTDLNKIEVQAFGYKNNQKDCVYVITSNFEKLRFYIDNAIENIEFNLFQLTEKEFELLYLCLAFENISKNIPKKIKEESVNQENQITKSLYKDYSVFKNDLFHNLTELNPQYEPLELFKKSQKLLDRFLFLFFAEDRQLLPPNSVRLILDQWKKLQELDEEIPLYDRYKKYFGYLNTGFKGKVHDVFAYNGGLFKPDEILDTIVIDDMLLYNHTISLAKYDFASEVDVNILGHIFENSLNELDEMKAKLEGTAIEKSTSKRKKDGVFYTPKYITKYIVENTVGKLCEEQKHVLQIVEEEYNTEKKRTKATKQPLVDKLNQYRNWLLQITIIDPACGSGAFLNEALNFLIAEHTLIDELQAKLFGDAMVLSDVEKSILENNLFGVDLNEESVEIAKLSLWLRTAQPNRKLNDLNDNIKCGNSLIDNPEIAGEKAFIWHNEFPQIFAKGGFDVVIGNPPYVDNRGFDKVALEFLYNKFPNSFKKAGTDKFKTTKLNLIAPFIELTNLLLKINGLTSFIFHKNIFKTNSYTSIREYILDNFDIITLTDWGAGQFQDVVAETASFVLKKGRSNHEKINVEFYSLDRKYLENEQIQSVFKNAYEYIFGIFANTVDRSVLEKIETNSDLLKDFVNVNNGVVTGNDSLYLKINKENEYDKKVVRGKDIKKYSSLVANEYVYYKKDELLRARDENIFIAKEKLVMQMINIEFVITYDNEQFYNLGTTYAITNKSSNLDLKYLLSVLNSRLIKFYYLKKFTNESSLTNAISTQNLFNIPIKNIAVENQEPLVEKSNLMLSLNKTIQEHSQKFQRTIQRKFELDDLPKKLQDWYKLSYSEFIKELAKKKVKLTLSEEAEWEDYFTQESNKALDLKAQIDATDNEIDVMVYELYGLTKEEIEIVEKS